MIFVKSNWKQLLLTSACSTTHARSSELTNGPPMTVIAMQSSESTLQGICGKRRSNSGTAVRFTEQSTPPKLSSH